MKYLLIVLCFVSTFAFAQKVDTVIVNSVYTSYFSKTYKNPLYVSYKIYKAGGKCDRNKEEFHFKNDTKLATATPKDYAGSGYDEGHLADAADFSADCKREELTFRFYNCVPQTHNLNAGVWKHWETVVREESQNDSLLIVCGSVFGSSTIGTNKVAVPDYCWKVVKSLTTGKITHVLWFTNTKTDNKDKVLNSVEELYSLTKYKFGI